jgi:hypothetical protein
MKHYLLYSFVWLSFLQISGMHPTHMSVVNMELNPEKKQINYSIRLFQDDINYLITSLYHEELFHSNEEFDFSKNTYKLENYFISSLVIRADELILKPQLIKQDINEFEYWLYFSIDLENIPNSLEISNRILTDFYKDQINLLIFSYNEKEKGLTFNANFTTQTISL